MSRVIRGSGPPARSVVPAEVYDAREEAGRILTAARAEADQIRQAARQQAAAEQQAARERDRLEARAEAAGILLEAARSRDRALTEAERDSKTLALAIAKRIVTEEIALSPERIVEITKDHLERARRAREVRVRVHPSHVQSLERNVLTPSVRICADETLEPGGCIIESELGEIDARVHVQLAAIARALGCDTP